MGVDFKIDISSWAAKVGDRVDVVVRKTVLSIGTSLVLKSPVGDPSLWKSKPPKGYVGGHFRANWQHGFNITPSGTVDAADAAGAATIEGMAQRVDATSGDGTHFLVNNLPYANRLEQGWSSQAPSGMVGLTEIEFADYVKEAAL